jgi:Flp pilus assembly protein TadG
MMLRRRERRAGAILVESALVYPILFVVVFGVIMLGFGVFRYQQVAHAAREGARWASVHGAQYAKERGVAAATPDTIYTNAILPQMGGADPAGLGYSVTWYTDAAGNPDKRPSRPYTYTDSSNTQRVGTVTNYVTVTVTYNWNTVLFGVVPVSATSVTPISY